MNNRSTRSLSARDVFLRASAIATKELQAYVSGLLYLTGAGVALPILIFGHGHDNHPALSISLGCVALVAGLILLLAGRWLPSVVLVLNNPAGAVTVTAAIWSCGTGDLASMLLWLYLLPVLNTFFLFRERAAICCLTFTLGCTVFSCAVLKDVSVGQAFTVIVMCLAIAVIVGWLVQASEQVAIDPATGLLNRNGLNRCVDTASRSAREGRGAGFSLIAVQLDAPVQQPIGIDRRQLEKRSRELIEQWRAVLPGESQMANVGDGVDAFVFVVASGDFTDDLVARLVQVSPALTFSVGVQGWRADMTPAELITRCLSSMHSAARAGGDQVCDPSVNDARVQELRRAMGLNELFVVYQPIVSLPDGKVVGAEALVRWTRPGGEVIPPDTFVPLAESSGDIIALGRWVLQQACHAAAGWQLGRPGWDKVTVNVAAAQLVEPDFVEVVTQALVASTLPASRLVLEVTERTIATSPELLIRTLTLIRELGVRIALDDFGTGYSTLSRIWVLPIDCIKIDKSFVDAMSYDDRAHAVVATIIAIGANLQLDVVAEGVETLTQADQLARLGCAHAQGYLFGRPDVTDGRTRFESHPVSLPVPVARGLGRAITTGDGNSSQ